MRSLQSADLTPWLEVRFDPARGPGGQHVNKVSTRATLCFDFRACPLLSEAERTRIGRRCAARLTRDGRLRVVAQQQRTQSANRVLAETRLRELLAQALYVPPKRVPTGPGRGAQQRRVSAKKRRGETKRQRRAPGPADD